MKPAPNPIDGIAVDGDAIASLGHPLQRPQSIPPSDDALRKPMRDQVETM
jgi:hypothetical protein